MAILVERSNQLEVINISKLKNWLRDRKREIKSLKWKLTNKINNISVQKGDVVTVLQRLGISPDDILFVHSSLSALGYVEGGPKTIVDALISVVGDRGTILMPTYPFRGSMYEHLSSSPVFDVAKDKSYMGAITEEFRKRTKYRSLHPTHSVSALGNNAEWFIKDHHLDITPFGSNSPFFKAYETGAKVLCIGSNIGHVTIYHIVEDIVKFPKEVYFETTFKAKVIDFNGNKLVVTTKCHNPQQSKRRIDNDPQTMNFIHDIFSSLKILKEEKLGKGIVTVMDAKKLVDFLIWGSNRGYTIYGDLNE